MTSSCKNRFFTVPVLLGSGKTTTRVELCRRNPGIRFLLVVFNRSVADHSRLVFPANVTVKTANSLAHGYVTKTYGRERFGKKVL